MGGQLNEDMMFDLLAKHFAGETSAEENEMVLRFMASRMDEYAALKEIWHLSGRVVDAEEMDIAAAKRKVYEKAGIGKNVIFQGRNRKKWLLRFAASVIIVAGAMVTLYFALGIGQKPDMRVVATGSTMKEEILLEDGSVVVLNSGSQLTYPKSFDDDSRDVILAGEAYFDVTPDKNRPFVIIAGNTGITVLGTSFNVYNSHTGTEVLVETGRVKFAGQSDPEKYVMLDPGDKGNYTDITKEIKKQKNSDPNIMAWKTGKLVFEETDLTDVCRTVEKVYHISIDIPDESIALLRLTATFNNLEAEQVLDIICQTLGLSLELHENKYKLSKNG